MEIIIWYPGLQVRTQVLSIFKYNGEAQEVQLFGFSLHVEQVLLQSKQEGLVILVELRY